MWKGVERCGKVWKGVEMCGKVWKGVEMCGKVWKGMESCGQGMERCERCRQVRKAVEKVRKGVERCFPYLPTSFHTFSILPPPLPHLCRTNPRRSRIPFPSRTPPPAGAEKARKRRRMCAWSACVHGCMCEALMCGFVRSGCEHAVDVCVCVCACVCVCVCV